jgi:hypothetical protein
MSALTYEQILQAKKRTVRVAAPELGGDIIMRAPSAGASMRFRSLAKRRENGEDVETDLMVEMIYSGVVDEAGNQLCADYDAARKLLEAIESETLQTMVRAYHGLREKRDGQQPGNSEGSPSASSPSGSPSL